MKKIKRLFRRIRRLFKVEYISKTRYQVYLKKLPVDEKAILLDSQHGKNIKGNIFYILKELLTNSDYKDYKIYVSVDKESYKSFSKFLESQNLSGFNLIKMGTFEYYKIVATSKYLISDTSFLAFFTKRKEQVYLNVWHGTPLKHLGKSDNSNGHAIGNVQKNFLVSDYLLYPNDYMKEHMINDYMLEDIYEGKVLMCGYPRNTVFYDDLDRLRIRKECQIDKKEVFVYMPTWRGSEDELDTIQGYLEELDKKLKANQILFVNLHPFIGDKIDYKEFKNIKKFPKEYETYQFLNVADCLITDYSSIFVDFANLNKKIILFAYDEKEYFETRGCYMTLEELPFTKVKTIDELVLKMNDKKKVNYDEFKEKFCKYDSIDATKRLCAKVILNKENQVKVEEVSKNNKKNVLIYTGSLAKNGITSSLMNLLAHIDINEYNYYLTFVQSVVSPNKTILKQLPKGIRYISTTRGTTATIHEKIVMYFYFKGFLKNKKVQDLVNRVYKNDIKRNYGDIKFDYVIQFGGYDNRKIIQFCNFDSKRIIYVHSDMRREVEVRKIQKENILTYAYNNYDTVAVVSEAMIKPTESFMKDSSKIKVVDNMIDDKAIIKKGNLPISFDDNTECNVDLDTLKNILNSNAKKFINVGRFSIEKGHMRLIDAFEKIWNDNKDTYLILIGGHGKIYNKTLRHISKLNCKDNVIVIKSLLNPFPIVKKCDCFILSSFYEGFGLCLVEADILGLTSFSVDIDGPKKFIEKYKGHLVPNSEAGIYQGMQDYLDGKIEKMQANYDEYNKIALEEFYQLFKD